MFTNHFVGIGNVVERPTLQTSDNGKNWVKFSIAVNEYYKEHDKTKQLTTFIPVVAWDRYAVNISRVIKTGQPILVQGPIRVKYYTDSEGVKRTSFQVEGIYFSWEPNWVRKTRPENKT